MVMPVCEIQVGVLQERGRRQQNVGMIRGVVLKLLQHHGEKILAPHARQHQVLIRSDSSRIRVVHHHRLHRRIAQLSKCLAEFGHVDDARVAPERRFALQFRHFERGLVEPKSLAGGKLQSAAHLLPRSDQRGQSSNRARGRSAAFAALNSVIQPNGRRPRGGVFARQARPRLREQCR